MILFKKYGLQLLLVVFVISAILVFTYDKGYDKANSQWQSKWDNYQLDIAKATLKAEQAERDKEHRWQQRLDKVKEDAKIQEQNYQRDLAAADAAASSLREQARKLAAAQSKTGSNSTADRTSEAAGTACMVLADVLDRIDQRAGELARYADESRAAGINCQAQYDMVLEF